MCTWLARKRASTLRRFHFNEVGNFTLLSDGTGYLVSFLLGRQPLPASRFGAASNRSAVLACSDKRALVFKQRVWDAFCSSFAGLWAHALLHSYCHPPAIGASTAVGWK